MVGTVDGNRWGWLARGEPAALYRDGTFYLYFTDVRCRQADCKGSPGAIRGISLAALLDELQMAPKQVAVELNLELVPRAALAERRLSPGDRLEVVTLVGGG